MEQSEGKTRVVVLLDGDNTTWAPDAAVIDVPDNVYQEDILAGDSKLLRKYIEGAPTAKEAVFALGLIAEVLYPGGIDDSDDPKAVWDEEGMDKIDGFLRDYGFGPKEKADE
jgi:hypothetical protein